MVQWLGLGTLTAKGLGSIPGWGTKISHAAGRGPPPQKKQKITSAGKDVEKLEPWCTTGGNGKWCSHSEHSMTVPQKIKNRITI